MRREKSKNRFFVTTLCQSLIARRATTFSKVWGCIDNCDCNSMSYKFYFKRIIMANKVIFILFFIIVGCYYGRGYLIRPYVKGYLYSKIDNAPIQNAFIYVDKKLFYAKSPSNITTDSKGYFFIKGYRDNNRQTMKLMQQFTFWWCFKKYDTTLDVPIIDIKES